MADPVNLGGPSLLGKALATYQTGSRAASWIFGIAFAAFFVFVFFRVPDPTPTQCDILRFLMSLTAGLFFFFYVGGVALHGTLKGIGVGAGGGAAMFVLMQFVVNPVPGCMGPQKKGKEWSGQELGQLIDTLRRQRAAGGDQIPTLVIPHPDEDRIMHFNPNLDKVTGKTWAEVFKRICDSTSGCLVCEISKDQQTVKLTAQGTWTKAPPGTDPKNYTYTCK